MDSFFIGPANKHQHVYVLRNVRTLSCFPARLTSYLGPGDPPAPRGISLQPGRHLNYEETPRVDVNLCFKNSANVRMIYFYGNLREINRKETIFDDAASRGTPAPVKIELALLYSISEKL